MFRKLIMQTNKKRQKFRDVNNCKCIVVCSICAFADARHCSLVVHGSGSWIMEVCKTQSKLTPRIFSKWPPVTLVANRLSYVEACLLYELKNEIYLSINTFWKA